MTVTRKSKIVNYVLWAAYLLALTASVSHLAWAFGTLEFQGSEWIGWLAALAVDAGLAALAYGVQQRKRARRPARDLWAGVLLFAGISAFANLLHGLTSATDNAVTVSTFGAIDPLALVKAIVLSATLPLLVVYLGEIVSSDDAQIAAEAERERARVEREALRLAEQTERERVRAEQAQVSTTETNIEGVGTFPMPIGQARAVKVEQDAKSKASAMELLTAYLTDSPDTPVSELARLIRRSRTTVYSYLSELESAGRIHRNGKEKVALGDAQ